MAVHIFMGVIVDRLDVCVGLYANSLYGKTISALWKMHAAQKELLPDGKLTITKASYSTRLDYLPVVGRRIAEIHVAMTLSGYKHLRLVLYPSQFREDDFATFKQVLASALQPVSYEGLYHLGNVSRLDLAFDSLTHKHHSFIPFRRRSNVSGIYQGWSETKGGIYLGASTSKVQFCTYDKAKQLVETTGKSKYPLRTRVEARLRRLGIHPCELQDKVKNPFPALEIAESSKALALNEDDGWSDFLWQCRTWGSCKALSLQPTKWVRQKYLKRLRESRALWWKPENIWSGFSEALLAISP